MPVAVGAVEYRAKVLAQSNPSATTSTDIYTVPAYRTANITGVVVCNRSGSAITFRLSVAVLGEALASKQYIYYDMSLPANQSLILETSWLLGTTDVVRVYASDTNVSFTLFGVEEPFQAITT
jgi:hypothetical protein